MKQETERKNKQTNRQTTGTEEERKAAATSVTKGERTTATTHQYHRNRHAYKKKEAGIHTTGRAAYLAVRSELR